MKIALDAKRALNNVAGLGQYSRILLNALFRDFPQHSYDLYTPKTKDFLEKELNGNFQLQFPESFIDRKLAACWRSYGITSDLVKNKEEVYHGMSNELPLNIHKISSLKKIVTIHDVIFLKHKDQYSAIDRKIYDYKTRYACNHADLITTVSEETRQDLIRFYNIKEEKIKVVYGSCSPAFYSEASTAQKEKVKTKYQLPEKYILNVSSYFARKNHRAIVEALELLKDKTDVHVVFVGGQGNIKEEIIALIKSKKLEDRFHLLSGVRNEEMPAIYQQASAFVYPSYYEGFGIPVLEALYSKLPVITTRGGCFEEVGGKNTLYVTPSDSQELAKALEKVLSNESLRQQMIGEGLLHASTMSDREFARKTMQLFES